MAAWASEFVIGARRVTAGGNPGGWYGTGAWGNEEMMLPLAISTGIVVIVVAIAVVLLALIVAASTRGRQRRKAQRRSDEGSG